MILHNFYPQSTAMHVGQTQNLPPENDFKILVVACPTFGFLVLALTAIPINGAATLTAGFKNLFHQVCVALKSFCNLHFFDPPSRIY